MSPIRAISGFLQSRGESPPAVFYRRPTTRSDETGSPVARVRISPSGKVMVAGDGHGPAGVFELPAIVFLGMWFFVQFLNGIGQLPVFQQDQISGGVAFWAHVMGFVSGLVLVVFMKRPERTRVDWWDTFASQQEIRRSRDF